MLTDRKRNASISSPPWFHTTSLPGEGEILTLGAKEARHAVGARRLGEGDVLTLFDGQGVVATARIVSMAGMARVDLEVIHRETHEPPTPTLWLASSLPKGDRQSIMLNMATQLGVSRFTALDCEHSVAVPAGPFWRRSERVVLEACKQSRQAHLPVIKSPREPGRFASEAVADGWTVLLADPKGASPSSVKLKGEKFAGMVGPEGGFTQEELDEAVEGGAQPVSLGDGILRVETAAIALSAYLRLATAKA